MHITDFALAHAEYAKLFPGLPFFETWIPESHFICADYDGENLSITRRDEKIYGMALGPSPLISSDWNSFSIESRAIADLPSEIEKMDEWDCYWAPTSVGNVISDREKGDSEIASFLEIHAPHSSVFPGNSEILRWVEIVEDGELLGVAALCRWQSGRVVVSSVATHSDRRGQGIGKKVMAASLAAAHKLGEEVLTLGVMHDNTSAHRLYQSMGFTLMHNFTYCERR